MQFIPLSPLTVLLLHYLTLSVTPFCLAVDAQTGIPRAAIDQIVDKGLSDGQMSGAVVMIANRKNILFEKAYGYRLVDKNPEPMTVDTVFDLASLTKPVATTTAVMNLVQHGKISLDQPVSNYLPEFRGSGKESILVSELLTHTGGLIPDNSLRDYEEGVEVAWQKICDLKMSARRGERFMYSDVGFIVLGKLVERISGKTLNQFTREKIFEPFRMLETGFLPNISLQKRAAANEKRNDNWMKGEVHDPRAYLLGGTAGHAGLFSTAGDLTRFGQIMLHRGNLSSKVLDPETFNLMTTPRSVPRGTRTYGWDHNSPYSRNRGTSFSNEAFGHGGFTGTVLWIDPAKDRVFIFLSNRLHPDGKGSINSLAGEIATLIGNGHAN